MPKRLLIGVLLAWIAESLALWFFLEKPQQIFSIVAVGLHVFAALACAQVHNQRSRSERDLVFLMALGLPGLGPLCAWALPGPLRTEEPQDAHAAFEEALQIQVSPVEKSQLTGFDAQHIQSYSEVLHHGDLAQRSGLVRKLALLGRPEHMRLLRRFLEDPDEELRIQAFLQLRSQREKYEARIRSLDKALPQGGAGTQQLALAHQNYAQSGLLEPELESLQWQAILKLLDNPGPQTQPGWERVLLQALIKMEQFEEAERVLAQIEFAGDGSLDDLSFQAQIQFQVRNWPGLLNMKERMRHGGHPIPEWMTTTLNSVTQEEPHHAG
ncbi:MAG: hypothetical protein GY930_03440 [bacterium]|nr:hypothetical protein [bacterium]